MPQDNKVKIKRILPIIWWKAITGLGLIGVGVFLGSFYISDPKNIAMGLVATILIAPGGWLAYTSIRQGNLIFTFDGKKSKYTGNENTVILFAGRNAETKHDEPILISFLELNHPPRGARLHYFRNYKKHFYELFNNTASKHLEPVKLPDKKPFPPRLFQLPATMQIYKEAIEYSPPTLMQKVAPGILLIAMLLVGILMVMTGG